MPASLTRDRLEAGTYVLGMVVQKVGLFLILPILLTELSVAEYAVFGLVQSMMYLLPAVISLNLPDTATRLYFDGRNPTEQRAIASKLSLASCLAAVGLGGALAVFCGIFARAEISRLLGLPEARAMLFVFMAIGGSIGFAQLQLAYSLFRAGRQPVRAALVHTSHTALFLALCGFFYLTQRLDLGSMVLSYTGAIILGGLVSSGITIERAYLPVGPGLRTVVRNGLRYALPLLPYLISVWVLSMGGRWIARALLDLEAVAYFTLATQLAAILGLFARAAYDSWAPRSFELFAAGSADTARDYLKRRGFQTVGAVMLLGLLLQIALVLLLPRVAPAYAPVAGIFPIVFLGPLFETAYLQAQTELLGTKRTVLIGIQAGVCIAIFLVSAPLGTVFFGIRGLAAAYSLTFACQWALVSFARRQNRSHGLVACTPLVMHSGTGPEPG